jgi:hypothetical protein
VRKAFVASVLVTAAALAVAGCSGGTPPGVDGNLTDNWPAMPAPSVTVPAASACYDADNPAPGQATLPSPVDCASRHTLETIHVGTFAAAAAPPGDGDPALRRAYTDCSDSARRYLGGDWRTARTGLELVVPTAAQWTGGARWYRCDAVEFAELDSYRVVAREGSLKGGLSGPRPLALGCFNVTAKGQDVGAMAPVDCATAHNGEFVGVWEAPAGPYPADAHQLEQARLDGCRGVIATYTGVPDDDKVRYRVGQITYGFGKADWDLGNRGARCYLWMENKTFTSSLKGAGPRALPINSG